MGERSRSAGEGDSAVHRVLPALVAGRTTPGLLTVTVVAAGQLRGPGGRALPALVLGSSLFLQAHLLLGLLMTAILLLRTGAAA
jgi:hypothetical protein